MVEHKKPLFYKDFARFAIHAIAKNGFALVHAYVHVHIHIMYYYKDIYIFRYSSIVIEKASFVFLFKTVLP